ncbi:MAG TPA: HAMP domain-containing sensor histidine kinase [Panacibacter sp.]|nr:HAMP domain-containing sensor histidine kinase [Panacibacter sp.]HNP45825.1 HAMP domain-containing sensor histidine kinase [Panacibacter sp.]
MMRFIPIICFLVIYCCSLPARGQFQVNHFNTENGLPSNGIKGLQWDESTGFLWIATEAGIVRYNGMGFKTFDINTNPEIGSNRIVCIVKNTRGNILAGGELGNLCIIKDNMVLPWFTDAGKARYNYNYYAALEGPDTLFKQCYKTPFPGNFSNYYQGALVSLNDTACVVLAKDSLFYYSVSTLQPVFIKSAPPGIRKVFTIGGKLYLLNRSGQLFACNVSENEYVPQQLTGENNRSFHIEETGSAVFWQSGMDNPIVMQQGKAWLLEKANEHQVTSTLVASGIPGNTLFRYAAYKKNGGYLFLGSASKGIYVIHPNQLLTKQPGAQTLNRRNSFYSQVELPDGNIITNEGIIIGDNPGHGNFNIGNRFLNSIFTINDSTIIYGGKDSLFLYDRKHCVRKLVCATTINDGFAAIRSEGHLYLCNQDGIGIIHDNGSIEFLQRYDHNTGIHLQPFDIAEISPGKLAIATCGGLLQFNTLTKKTDTLLKLQSVCIRSLHKDGDYLFIGTYGGGYYMMKNGILKAMPLDINQYLKYTHCFIKDDAGYYWISTNNGLFKVRMTDMIDAYEKNIPQLYYHYLGKEDGMETTEMNGGCTPCAIRLHNGMFSFPTMDGLLWVDPANTNIELPSGVIYIDRFLANGNPVNVAQNQNMELGRNVSRVDIALAVNAWCRKENLYLEYKLNNSRWFRVEMVAGEPKISFASLGYGTYTLSIRKMNGFGTGNYSFRDITFTIPTPFYQQWWFRILVLLALAVLAYLVFRWRLHRYNVREKKLTAMVEQKTMDLNLKNIQLEKNNQINLRLISIINHDIMTPLKFMHYAGKALVDNKGTISEGQQAETISEITQTARDMEQLSSQILNWIIYHNPDGRMQKEEFDLHQLVEVVIRVLQFSAKEKHTLLQNKVPLGSVVNQFLEPMRVMIYNIVLNSLNFTKNGTITIESHNKDNKIVLQVSDNGLGMTQQQIDNLLSDEKTIASINVDQKKGTGLGYLIIKDLLKMMEGSLEISSILHSGTTVIVTLPV